MTSKIIVAIVAIVAAVLSLAAPVAVEAQTPTGTVNVNTVGLTEVTWTGSGSYTIGRCWGASASPTCNFSAGSGRNGVCGGPLTVPIIQSVSRGFSRNSINRPYTRWGLYSDSSCSTEAAFVTFTKPTSLPTLRARDITGDSATIYIEEPVSEHGVTWWNYVLTPPVTGASFDIGRCRTVTPGRRPSGQRLTGLSPNTAYRHEVYEGSDCRFDRIDELPPLLTVSFTTAPGPPPPEPPTGVDGAEPTTAVDGGSVTISWANPGDPDIATYEYSLRQAGGPAGEWTTIPGSNADTTGVTIDLATGEARAVNNATPPMTAWTIHLRARDVNGNAGGIFTTTVNTAADGTTVPALPLAGLAILALFLFMSGQRKRKGG